MKLQLNVHAIRVKEATTFSLKPGDYLIVNEDSGSAFRLSPDQYRAMFGVQNNNNDRPPIKRKFVKRTKSWTNHDSAILRTMQELNAFSRPADILAAMGLRRDNENHNMLKSRLRFLQRRGLVQRKGEGRGHVKWIITAVGKRHEKPVDLGEPIQRSVNDD